MDTPYVGVVICTLANPEDPRDLAIAHELQDQIEIKAGSDEPFVLPNYDKASYEATLEPILDLAKGLKRYTQTFGARGEVNPIHFMIGTASAWGGLPDKDAQYILEAVRLQLRTACRSWKVGTTPFECTSQAKRSSMAHGHFRGHRSKGGNDKQPYRHHTAPRLALRIN